LPQTVLPAPVSRLTCGSSSRSRRSVYIFLTDAYSIRVSIWSPGYAFQSGSRSHLSCLGRRHPAFDDSCAGGREARRAGELGRQFCSSQPTISKHLKVLEQAGIVERKVGGRVHQFRLRRKALEPAGRWIARHQAFWEGAVNQLDRLLAESAER
jgi:DNA-binding transcriptional ArsR family regulator